MTTDEDAFLRKILESPADDITRLVYADWLQERNEPVASQKAEFLRLEVEIETAKKGQKNVLVSRLQSLAAELDTDWLAVVSKIPIEECDQEAEGRATHDYIRRYVEESVPSEFLKLEFECPQKWEKLVATEDRTVRYCQSCKENVYYCDTIKVAREHARQGLCVAVDLGIIRKKGDLEPPRLLLGRMLPDAVDRVHTQE
jgi:uncharacterized protein (TIGR02996 family)